jgi:RNA polymerase sigma factor (sigma-70 family)
MELDLLVKRFQEKDEKAFEELYNMYNESINGVVFNIVRDADIAEEIMQDVFIKAWNNSATYTAQKGRFFTWILNIARNAAIDKTRSKTFKNAKQNLEIDNFVNILQAKPSDEEYEQKYDVDIKKLVSQLGEKCLKLIDMIYFQGFTQHKVSIELDIPLGTIKTRNRSCLKTLRTMTVK